MRNKLFIVLCLVHPLILYSPGEAMGQQDAEEIITWSCNAVRADAKHFDFFIEAHIKKGWELYKPNQKKCLLSPVVTFANRMGIKPVGQIDVIEGIECDTMSRFCLVPRYRNHVKFIQSFEMPETMSQVVSGEVVYQPVKDGYAPSPFTYSFSLRVGDTTEMVRADSTVLNFRTEERSMIIKRKKKTRISKTWSWIRYPPI